MIAVIAVSAAVLSLSSPKRLQCGYTEIEGSLELLPYPKISDSVPTVMVYVVIPMYEQQQIYLTEDGMLISSLEGFGENDSVTIEGVFIWSGGGRWNWYLLDVRGLHNFRGGLDALQPCWNSRRTSFRARRLGFSYATR